MIIEHIHVDGFGKLSDFDTGPSPLGPLVVVLGPNEAGKSTLFTFLTTALYGFQPASRDRNPHVPWGSESAGGSIRLRTSDSACVRVERRLRSSPSGSLTRDAVETDLRNQPVPWVDHVPRTVFTQVFAVTLAELAGLDDETWARIQDRVLGSMGASDLRSARDVADALEREASEIWRPNRRGNQRLRALQDRMRALRGRRTEALERDRTVRALVEEQESVEARLRDVRLDLQRDRVVVERVQELLPLKRQLDRIEALRIEGGRRQELVALPVDPRARLEELERERAGLGRVLAELEQEMAEPRAVVAGFDADVETLLTRREAITDFLRGEAAWQTSRDEALRTERTLVELAHRLSAAAEHSLSAPLSPDACAAIAGVSIDLLRDRVQRFEAMIRSDPDRRGAGSTGPAPGRRPAGGPLVVAAVTGGGGALLAWGLLAQSSPGIVAGTSVLAIGLALAAGRRGHPAASPPAETAHHALQAEISAMVSGVPLRGALLEPPSSAVVDALARMQGLLAERMLAEQKAERCRQDLRSREAEAEALASVLGWPPTSPSERLAVEVEQALRDAERTRDRAEDARREVARLRRLRDAAARDLEEVEAALRTLLEQLDRVAGSASLSSVDDVHRRIDAHRRADRIEEELERAHPDLTDLKAAIRAVEAEDEPWSIDELDLADRRVRIEQATSHIEELVSRSTGLQRDVAHLRELETVDAVDGEHESLRDQEARLVAERDRKWIMAQVIREADRTFREEHQPDLLRRASGYLERLTEGRYDRMLVDERSGGHLFQLVGPGLPAPVPLARPISTGTLEQAYLSLRLAIVDHLDHEGERLPLFIDEAFVNWDARRRDRGLEVLAEVARTRQVFAFTCHPEMAARLEASGAGVLQLRR